MTFKEKLVILRKSKGLTQDEFASAVGVSRQAVYKWESGQSYPEVPKLLEMKLLFTISIDELLDDNYDLPLPDKKKRKRAPKQDAPKAEAKVTKPVAPKAVPAPKAEPVAPKAAPVAPAAPKVEPVAPKAAPVAPVAPKAEPVAPKAAPVAPAAPKVEPVAPKAAPVAPAAPKAEPVAPKAAPVAPAVPKAEPVAPKAAPVAPAAPKAEPAPKVDTVPSPIILEDIVNEEETKNEPAKKTGFFDRLFGRK